MDGPPPPPKDEKTDASHEKLSDKNISSRMERLDNEEGDSIPQTMKDGHGQVSSHHKVAKVAWEVYRLKQVF